MNLDIALGRAQHRALCFAVTRALRLRRSVVTVVNRGVSLTVPYLHRHLDGAGSWRVPSVLVHGFGADKETWLLMASLLSRRRPLVLLDMPGFGRASEIPRELASPAAQARSLLRILEAIGLRRVDLIGNSMGGGISLRAASDEADRVHSLTLINSLGPSSLTPESPKGGAVESDFGRQLREGDNILVPEDPDQGVEMMEMLMSRRPLLPRSMLRHAAAQRIAAREQLGAIFQGWTECPPEDELPGDLATIQCPTLVICGERDRIIHPAIAHAMADALADAELVSMTDVGHLPQLESPRRTAQAIERFLDRASRASAHATR